jgi:hypothetical protein
MKIDPKFDTPRDDTRQDLMQRRQSAVLATKYSNAVPGNGPNAAGTIEHDCRQPGRDLRLSPELVQMLAGGEKSVLNRIFGIGSVAQKSKRTSVKRG